MEFSQIALENKKKYVDYITSRNSLLNKVIEKHIKEEYQLKQLKREWAPGGGSILFQITTPAKKIFLKVMSLEIFIESKLESEESFIEIPSIRNEYNFIKEIKSKLGSEHVPQIGFYEESENFGFLATEWLEPFDDVIKSMDITETIEIFNKISEFIKKIFMNDILYTDIHEKNIRFRNKMPVVIDYGETRYFRQDLLFEESLAYLGTNRYGSLGEIPILNKKDVQGYTCLQRLKEVFDNYMVDKLLDYSRECKFDNSCSFNVDAYQEPDDRIYQSVRLKGLVIDGHRPMDDEREELVKQICKMYGLKYGKVSYIDIGSNLGSFCFKIAVLTNVVKVIGIEAFKNYLVFAKGFKFISNAEKVSFYNLICGEDNIYEEIKEFREDPTTKRLVSIMSTYHHIKNREKCIDDLKKIRPAILIIEFATQNRYYPERGDWKTEMAYIKYRLNYDYSITLCTSRDYKRPIVAFTNGKASLLVILFARIYLAVKTRKMKHYLLPLVLTDTRVSQDQTQDIIDRCEKAIKWLKTNKVPTSGISVSAGKSISYPEVTGYTIPSLYQWGEKELAIDLSIWLIKQQNEDGSFSAPDGTPYSFDTGQVIRGFVAALDDLPEAEKPLRKACDWILTQVQSDGRLATPSTEMWGDIADDRIHLYVLPPLIEAGKKLNEPKYIDAAHRILDYYKQKKDLTEFNTLSHFYAYIIEALCDLKEIDLAKKAMEHVAALQKKDGNVPAYKNVSWVCSPGLAQFAVIWYKFGMTEYADKAVHYLEKAQNRSGGFYGSYGKGANYFPEEEISWAVKFFLDAYYWKIKTAFNLEVDIFPESIDENDGRVQEILSFFGDLNGKKVIDVGCGKGRFLRILKEQFPKGKLYGLDISEEMLDFCPDGTETICGSLLDIRYPDAYFDCAYCVEALEHALRTESAIIEMVRILKPGGKIVIIDKNIAKLGSLKLEPWEQWFKPKEVINLLSKYGVKAHYKPIAYEKHDQPPGLFIAWEGVKNA